MRVKISKLVHSEIIYNPVPSTTLYDGLQPTTGKICAITRENHFESISSGQLSTRLKCQSYTTLTGSSLGCTNGPVQKENEVRKTWTFSFSDIDSLTHLFDYFSIHRIHRLGNFPSQHIQMLVKIIFLDFWQRLRGKYLVEQLNIHWIVMVDELQSCRIEHYDQNLNSCY